MTKPLVTALAAMTVACPEPEKFVSFLTGVWDWEVLHAGSIGNDLEKLWGIEAGNAGDAFTILRSRGANRGMLRIIKGAERARARQRAARWGGFELVVMSDIEDIHAKMMAHAESVPYGDVSTYDFTHVGSNIHKAFSARLSGGTHVTMTMAVTLPKDRGFPHAEAQVGHIFEVPVTTPDYARSRAFYEKTLQMIPVLESSSTDGPMHSAWGIPAGPKYWLDILKGDAPDEGLGSIEIHGTDADFIDPDEGIKDRLDGGACLATLTSVDVMAVYAAIKAYPQAVILSEPAAIDAAPYNGARAFCFLGPDGERIEVCETMWA